MSNETISKINSYIDTYLFEPQNTWPNIYFEERSYSRWAANEIIYLLLEQENIRPIELISRFAFLMGRYSDKSSNHKSQWIFSIAKDIAEDIQGLLLKG